MFLIPNSQFKNAPLEHKPLSLGCLCVSEWDGASDYFCFCVSLPVSPPVEYKVDEIGEWALPALVDSDILQNKKEHALNSHTSFPSEILYILSSLT